MLRLTTNVTVSPASSARSSSAAWRISSIASGRVSANSAVSSSASSGSPVAGLLDRRPAPVRADRRGRARCGLGAAPRDEAPVLQLDRVEHALREPLGVDVLRGRRTGARSARSRRPAGACAPGGARGRGARGRCGRRWRDSPPRSVAPAATSSAHQSARFGRHLDADVGHQPARLRDQPLHVLDRSPAWPSRAAAGCGAGASATPVASTRAPPHRRSAPAPARSSAGGGRSSAGSPPGCARARRAARPAPPARRCAPPRSRRCPRGSRW